MGACMLTALLVKAVRTEERDMGHLNKMVLLLFLFGSSQ